MEERSNHASDTSKTERVNPTDKSFLEIGQELCLLLKAAAFRISSAFWNLVPLTWHKTVKCGLKLSLVTILVILAFVIGWYASKSKYGADDYTEQNVVSDSDLAGECNSNKKDANSCDMYYRCENGRYQHKHCPKFHNFDPHKLQCVWIHQSSCGKEEKDDGVVAPDIPESGAIPTLRQALAAEEMLTNHGDISVIKARLITLPSDDVELVEPGRRDNPANTKLVESIISSSDWDYLFPKRHPSYSYTNFLRAIAKFPAVCYASNPAVCRKVLATMFAHFTQETGDHNPSLQIPEWRQGLVHVQELGCDGRDCGYSANCGSNQWTARAWPCGKDDGGGFLSYHGRGAKQLSYNYNYGQFSTAMYGDSRYLLDNPHLVADTWLNFASAVWFFATPQPPKPSMLGVVEGDWKPNQSDLRSGLRVGFGLTTNIINGGIECGKGTETQQARNRVDYFRNFAKFLRVEVMGELGCARMKSFDASGSSIPTYWEQDWSTKYKCKLVSYQTPYSALIEGEYIKCVQDKFKITLS